MNYNSLSEACFLNVGNIVPKGSERWISGIQFRILIAALII